MQRVFRSSLVAKRVLQCHPAARQRVAAYYVKPKQKASASGQAWLALGGVTAGIACMGVYFLGTAVLTLLACNLCNGLFI